MSGLDIFFKKIEDAKVYIEGEWQESFPSLIIMTGTGLSSIVDELTILAEIPYADIPHFPRSTVTSHKGTLAICEYAGCQVAVLAGRWHYYEGYSTKEFTLPIRVMRMLGAEKVIFTNVAGGVNPSYESGDLVLINDHINTIPDHPLRGEQDDRLGIRFPDMLATYNEDMRTEVLAAANSENIELKSGVYYALQGPSLETPAEYKMIHTLGADLVGMSTVPEVIVAKHTGLKVAAVSIVSNVCYPPERITETTIDQVIAVANEASVKLNLMLKKLLSALANK